MDLRKLLKVLGPGLLYAGAAVGVSHLVQSTRAGVSNCCAGRLEEVVNFKLVD